MWSCSVGVPHRKALTQNSFSFCDRARRILAELCSRGNPFFALLLVAPTLAGDAGFLGKNSCASSSCHGGGGANQNQNIVWSQKDAHSRAPATLTTARSKRLAQLLQIEDATRDYRCTSCHAPWQNLAPHALPANTSVTAEAVSCESCHGPASQYIRSHTRTDLSRAEKQIDGLYDLTLLYNRANNCVACHQVIDPPLLEAGHPELLFELDGQTAAMPRHWRETETNTHAATWLTGQAAALRELTAQLRSKPSDRGFIQWQSALWVVNHALTNVPNAAPFTSFDTNAAISSEKLTALHRAADELALNGETIARKPELMLQNLCAASFPEKGTIMHAAQAERLVVGIDRLLYSLKDRPPNIEQHIAELFKLVQARPDFDAKKFGIALKNLQAALPR
jgi:hypothetical protein